VKIRFMDELFGAWLYDVALLAKEHCWQERFDVFPGLNRA
jgi:hypothetical protein